MASLSGEDETTITGTKATITNTCDTDKFCLAVNKVWDDENDAAGFRPDVITVALYKKTATGGYEAVKDSNGTAIEFDLSDTNGWAALAMGLPISEDGEAIEYFWKETSDDENFDKYTTNEAGKALVAAGPKL